MRARVLCAQVGDTPQLFPPCGGLCRFYLGRGAYRLRGSSEGTSSIGQRSAADQATPHQPVPEAVTRLGRPCSSWANTPPPGHILSRESPSAVMTMERTLTLRHGMASGVMCLALPA